MLESLIGAVLEGLFELLWWIILWPVALIVCTPLVLLYALFTALRHKQRFFYAVSDGYSSVSDFWKR
ncbi:MAG: hypothetical protein QOD99_2915 [Chthoniobacter sp.]|nr:hypothetical protein [Chthoniobacter sp.]